MDTETAERWQRLANEATEYFGFTHFVGIANSVLAINSICPSCGKIVLEGGEYPCGAAFSCDHSLAREKAHERARAALGEGK